MKNIGVLLSGCGYLDGAEIRESVLTLLAIDQATTDYKVTIFAPNFNQHHTVSHTTQNEISQTRNMMEEAARIARGEIEELRKVNPDELDALLIPGGFGVAKNLSKFAFKGATGDVIPEVENLIQKLYEAQKPIGAICIAPAMMALVLGKKNIEVTIGNDRETALEIEKTGAKHVNKQAHEYHWDSDNKIATTPAYMYGDGKISDIYQGIKGCVDRILSEI